jgi:hypothetical protein
MQIKIMFAKTSRIDNFVRKRTGLHFSLYIKKNRFMCDTFTLQFF